MNMPPPRPGYNRDGWTDQQPDRSKDPIVVNYPALAVITGFAVAVGGFIAPLSIILWRAAL